MTEGEKKAETPRGWAKKPLCLKCMGSGKVLIYDPREKEPEQKACPDGCKRPEVRHD